MILKNYLTNTNCCYIIQGGQDTEFKGVTIPKSNNYKEKNLGDDIIICLDNTSAYYSLISDYKITQILGKNKLLIIVVMSQYEVQCNYCDKGQER